MLTREQAIEILEQMARYHIMIGHMMCEYPGSRPRRLLVPLTGGTADEFVPKQNRDKLSDCMLELLTCYKQQVMTATQTPFSEAVQRASGHQCPNEHEIRGYQLLRHLNILPFVLGYRSMRVCHDLRAESFLATSGTPNPFASRFERTKPSLPTTIACFSALSSRKRRGIPWNACSEGLSAALFKPVCSIPGSIPFVQKLSGPG